MLSRLAAVPRSQLEQTPFNMQLNWENYAALGAVYNLTGHGIRRDKADKSNLISIRYH